MHPSNMIGTPAESRMMTLRCTGCEASIEYDNDGKTGFDVAVLEKATGWSVVMHNNHITCSFLCPGCTIKASGYASKLCALLGEHGQENLVIKRLASKSPV